MKRKALLFVALVLLFSFGVIGASAQTNDNIVDIAAGNADFETLHAAIVAAGLADTLASADAEFTVFAPTDAAFAALEASAPGTLASVLADPQGALTTILTYHVVPGRLMSGDVVAADMLTTVQGEALDVAVRNGEVYVDGARVTAVDIPAKNGVIHVIDSVLLPKAITGAAAAAEVPAATAAVAADMTADAAPLKSIAEVAAEAGSFTKLLGALQATGLATTFAMPGNYTVFAPTDAAFEALGDVNLSEEQLTTILLYHVVGDSLTRDQLATDDLVPTLADGRPLFVNRDGGRILDISGAKVLVYNIPASNGVIHVIDRVLIP